MIITAVYDHDARKKSYSLLADAFGLGKKGGAKKCRPCEGRDPYRVIYQYGSIADAF
jgi:hypothetical protein